MTGVRHGRVLGFLPRRSDAIVFAIASAIRVGVLFFWGPGRTVVSDMGNYDRVAYDLAHGIFKPDHTFIPIGYPAFLATIYATVGRHFSIVGLVQALLGAVTCVLVGRLARRFGASERMSLVAALVAALYPPLVYYGAFLLTEALAPFLFTATIWLTMRVVDAPKGWGPVAAAGVMMSCATAVRPNLLVVYPFLMLVIVASCRPDTRRGARLATAFLVSALPLLALIAVHNSRLLGRPAGLSTNGGMNFLMLQADYMTFESPDSSWTPIRNGLRYASVYKSPVLSYDERFLYREGWSWLLRRPDKFRHLLSNLGEGFGVGMQGYWPANSQRAEHPLERTALRRLMRRSSQAFPWLLVLPVIAAGAALFIRAPLIEVNGAALLLGFGMTCAIMVTTVLFLADPRMHVPFDPVLIGIVGALRWRTPGG